MSIITITIVLNILSRFFQSHGSRVMIGIVSVPCDPHVSPVISCAAMRDRPLCIRCTSVCSCQICLCVLCQWMSKVSQDRIFFFVPPSMISAGLLSEAGLGLGDVDFDAVSTFRGGVLSYWRRALCCHQPFPGFLPLLVHSWVHASVLPRWQLGLRLLLWHRWWKLLVFILRKSC